MVHGCAMTGEWSLVEVTELCYCMIVVLVIIFIIVIVNSSNGVCILVMVYDAINEGLEECVNYRDNCDERDL